MTNDLTARLRSQSDHVAMGIVTGKMNISGAAQLLVDIAREAADTIDRLTSTGEAVGVTDDAVERLAAHLCDEHDDEFQPQRNASWPEDENDDGKREGGYIAIQPKHVQARAREIARRILSVTPAISPREGHVEAPPTHWAVYSRTGMHIGLWTDEAIAKKVAAGSSYPGSTIVPLSALPHNQGEAKP